MNEDRGNGAMPKLYGAPAYARPPVVAINAVDRPFDPDALPLEAERSPEDEDVVQPVEDRSFQSVAAADPTPVTTDESAGMQGRAFRLRLPGRGQDGR